jgi:hypothetical protein
MLVEAFTSMKFPTRVRVMKRWYAVRSRSVQVKKYGIQGNDMDMQIEDPGALSSPSAGEKRKLLFSPTIERRGASDGAHREEEEHGR